jgi:diguanylate cyclase
MLNARKLTQEKSVVNLKSSEIARQRWRRHLRRSADNYENGILVDEILRLTRVVSQLEIETRTDALTGLLNRRGFMDELSVAWHRGLRQKIPTCLIMLDMNQFKQINDSYGHEIGDQALKVMAEHLRKCLRENDVIGRIGGDEFAIVLAYTDPLQTIGVMNKLVEFTPILHVHTDTTVESIPLPFAMGFTELTSAYVAPKSWLHAADKQMYSGKTTTAI